MGFVAESGSHDGILSCCFLLFVRICFRLSDYLYASLGPPPNA